MLSDKLIKKLENIGLSENESRVYLASLSLGPAIVRDIARVSQVKRTTIYSLIDSLKQQGLMHVEEKGLKKLFTPSAPEKTPDLSLRSATLCLPTLLGTGVPPQRAGQQRQTLAGRYSCPHTDFALKQAL